MKFQRRSAIAALCASWCMNIHKPAPALGIDDPLRVRFYADITTESCLQLESAISNKIGDRTLWMQMCESSIVPPIHLHVNSHGGSLIEGLHAFDYLSNVENLHTHIHGLCASAATLLTIGGKHRTMTPHSLMLIHQPSLEVSGRWKFTDIEDEMVNMGKSVQQLLSIYNSTTSLSVDELKDLISNEQYLTATECLKYGFIDEII